MEAQTTSEIEEVLAHIDEIDFADGRTKLIPDIIKAVETSAIGIVRALQAISKIYPNSPTQTFLETRLPPPFCDKYTQRYLDDLKTKNSPFKMAERAQSLPCTGMEEFIYDHLRFNSGIAILTPSEGEPQTVWVFKMGAHGTSEEEFDILLNLATLETFLPGRELCRKLYELYRKETVLPAQEALKDLPEEQRRIHFARLVYHLKKSTKSCSFSFAELIEKRNQLLGQYTTIL